MIQSCECSADHDTIPCVSLADLGRQSDQGMRGLWGCWPTERPLQQCRQSSIKQRQLHIWQCRTVFLIFNVKRIKLFACAYTWRIDTMDNKHAACQTSKFTLSVNCSLLALLLVTWSVKASDKLFDKFKYNAVRSAKTVWRGCFVTNMLCDKTCNVHKD